MNRTCCTLITTLLLVLCMFSNSTSADDELKLKQLRQWHGKFRSNDLRKFAPANNAIRDEMEWEAIWNKWRPNEPLPKVDFEKRMIAVATVNGPNDMNAHRLKLEDDGDLKIIAASTRMGGPGFGFLFVEVDRMGITSIHGVALDKANDKKPIREMQPIGDSILVDIVGTGKSGVVAIGGESTGATITAHGLTWELDLRRFRLKQDAIDGKRIAVKGELNVKKGVEIRERKIVLVHSLKILPDGDGPVFPPLDISAFNKIILEKSGGFAGISVVTTVMGDGKTTRENERERVTESFDLKADQLAKLHQVVDETDWSKIPEKNVTRNAADLFQYRFTITTEQKTFDLMADDMAVEKIPALQKLLEAMK